MEKFFLSLEWEDSPALAEDTAKYDGPLTAATLCHLHISCGDCVITKRKHPPIREQRKDSFIVSAYPLAIWFARAFYRIFHETDRSHADWEAAHQMAYAGDGYAWPDLLFCPVNAEEMQLVAWTASGHEEQFLVSNDDLLCQIKSFLIICKQRLEEYGHNDTELHDALAYIFGNPGRDLRVVEGRMGLDVGSLDPQAIEQERKEYLDLLQSVVQDACGSDSNGVSAYADALRILAGHGRCRIIKNQGRRVIVEWI